MAGKEERKIKVGYTSYKKPEKAESAEKQTENQTEERKIEGTKKREP